MIKAGNPYLIEIREISDNRLSLFDPLIHLGNLAALSQLAYWN
ncbi:hypothetical protein S1OALGB6SA_960 [Olavius algarvensis spirochete endosymbiont]|nr:hypothetical protein S1OALGB6SA_960 [Olavius algarvensis spirochete endosymbiont]